MSAPAAAKTHKAQTHSVAYNLGLIALALLLLGVAIAYAVDAAARAARLPPHRTATDAALTRTIGGKELTIPLSWFRYAEQRGEGFAKQVDLRLTLPLGPEGGARDIDVTLLPRSAARPSARLLDGVYVHLFEEGELSGEAGIEGLIGKPLKATSGYAAETVWYDPISADPFVAKCSAPVAVGSPGRCLRTVHLAPGLAAVYAFDADVLVHWRDFDPALHALLERIGALS